MFLRFRCLDLNTRHNHSTSLRFCFQGCLQNHFNFRNWMAWYLSNTDLKPFLLLNIQFAQGFQKALSGFLVPFRFPWASKSTRSAAKTESLKPRSQFLIFYAQGSAIFGVHTPVSRYCSHKNHFPSLPRWRSFIGRGLSAPPHGIKSFIYPCSSAETWLLSTTIVYGSEGV